MKRRAEESVRKSEAQLHLLASSMEDVISLSDTERRTLYVSPSLERLLGERLSSNELALIK